MGLIKRHARRLFRSKIRKPARVALKNITGHWCPECQKNVDLFHVCAPKSDFKQRRTQQARAERRRRTGLARAEQRRRRRERAGAGQPRERREHDYRTCRDQDCPRKLCQAFREGQAACPLPHQ